MNTNSRDEQVFLSNIDRIARALERIARALEERTYGATAEEVQVAKDRLREDAERAEDLRKEQP